MQKPLISHKVNCENWNLNYCYQKIQRFDGENVSHLTHNTRGLEQEVNGVTGQTRYSRQEEPEDKIQPSESLHI